MAKHAVVRTDKLTGTDDRARLVSVRYQPTVSNVATMTAIENGNFVLLGDLETGSREVYKGATPTASSELSKVVLVASPEVMYDERLRDLDDFINEAGTIARGYRLHTHDIFSVTALALDGVPSKATDALGKIVELQAGTKAKLVSSATNGSTTIGKVIDVNVVGKYTYFAIEVA